MFGRQQRYGARVASAPLSGKAAFGFQVPVVPIPTFHDTFVRANAANIATNAPIGWHATPGGSDATMAISGNMARNLSGSAEAGAYLDIASKKQTVKATLGVSDGRFCGVLLNGTTQATDGYAFLSFGGTSYFLFRNGSNTGVAASGAAAVGVGTVIEATSDGAGHIQLYVNGKHVGSYTDATPLVKTTCGLVITSGSTNGFSDFYADPTGTP